MLITVEVDVGRILQDDENGVPLHVFAIFVRGHGSESGA